jgi:hypothetical protein
LQQNFPSSYSTRFNNNFIVTEWTGGPRPTNLQLLSYYDNSLQPISRFYETAIPESLFNQTGILFGGPSGIVFTLVPSFETRVMNMLDTSGHFYAGKALTDLLSPFNVERIYFDNQNNIYLIDRSELADLGELDIRFKILRFSCPPTLNITRNN